MRPREKTSRGFDIQWLLVTLNSTDLTQVAAALMPTHSDKKAWDQKINLVVIEGPPSRFYLQNFDRSNNNPASYHMADEALHIAGFEALVVNYPQGQQAGEQGEAIWRRKDSHLAGGAPSYSGFAFGPGDEMELGSGARIAHCAAVLRGTEGSSGDGPGAAMESRYDATRRTVAVVGHVLPC